MTHQQEQPEGRLERFMVKAVIVFAIVCFMIIFQQAGNDANERAKRETSMILYGDPTHHHQYDPSR